MPLLRVAVRESLAERRGQHRPGEVVIFFCIFFCIKKSTNER
jgi:hypothetical protein